ncbi:MAG: hypothetical protein WBF53_06010, partial [Litorimonas sp.]
MRIDRPPPPSGVVPLRPDLAPAAFNPVLLSAALDLAGAHAFEAGEDGRLDFADPAAVERFLVE